MVHILGGCATCGDVIAIYATEKEEFMPKIDDGKSRLCIDEILKDFPKKVQFTKNDKI